MLFSGLKQLLCLVSPSNVCHQHFYQHIQIQAVALMTVLQGCAVATIRGDYYVSCSYSRVGGNALCNNITFTLTSNITRYKTK